MSPSPPARALASSPPPAPWVALPFLLAALAAIGVGTFAALGLKWFALLCIVGAALYALERSVRDPWFAFRTAVVLYPIMAIARPLHNAYGWPVFTSGVRLFPELFQCLIIAHIVVAALKRGRAAGTPFPVTANDLPVVVYMIAAVYSFVIGCVNVHPAAPINGWFVSITPAVWFLVVRWLRPDPATVRRNVYFLVYVYIALAIPSLLDYFIRPEATMRLMDAERGYFVPQGMSPFVFWRIYPRMQSYLFEENVFGTVSVLVALFSAAHLMARKPRPALYALFALGIICSVLTISRGSWMTFAIGLSIMLLINGRHRPRITALLACVVVMTGGAFMLWKDSPFVEYILPTVLARLSQISPDAAQRGELANDRTHQWREAWAIFLATPSGSGLGTVGIAAHYSKVAQHVVGDGIYFRVLAEQGVPGIVAFAFTLGGITWVLWRYLPVCDVESRPLCATMLGFHIGYCVQSIGGNTFDLYYVTPMYWMMLGFAVCLIERSHGKAIAAAQAGDDKGQG